MALNLPSLDAAQHRARPNAKPPRRKLLKGRKDRAEAKVKHIVRMLCVARDGYCRFTIAALDHHSDQRLVTCEGPSAWAHMHVKRRSQTRNQAPEIRHTTAASLMLCTRHHDEYDGRQKPRLFITALTKRGADGPLKFRRAK